MKKQLLLLPFLALSAIAFSQPLKTIKAKAGTEADYEELNIALNGGCSLGCAIDWTISTSSTLSPQGSINYNANNMNDGEKETAWVEGAAGYGVGEKIFFTFEGDDDPVKGIPFRGFQLTNGYAKNLASWKTNSRVKTFRLSLNNKPLFLIELVDSIFPQEVNLGKEILVSTGDIVTLEIINVYKGSKFPDTAISDISLDGAH